MSEWNGFLLFIGALILGFVIVGALSSALGADSSVAVAIFAVAVLAVVAVRRLHSEWKLPAWPYDNMGGWAASVILIGLGIGLIRIGGPTQDWIGFGFIALGVLVLTYFFGRATLLQSYYWAKVNFERLFTSKRDLHQGVLTALQGRFDEALQLLARYDLRHPNDPASLAARSAVLLQLARFDEAVEAAEHAISINRTGDGVEAKGTVLLVIGDMDSAIQELERVIQGARDAVLATETRALLSSALIQRRRLNDALKVLDYEHPGWKASLSSYYRGEAHRLLGDGQAAVQHYREACGRAQREILASLQRSSLLVCALARAGKLEEAEKAAAQLPETGVAPSPLYARALLALKQERYIEARDALQRLVRVVPHEVVVALEDPDFAVLLRHYSCEELLAEARRERERILESIRRRIRPAPDPDAGPAYDTGGLRP